MPINEKDEIFDPNFINKKQPNPMLFLPNIATIEPGDNHNTLVTIEHHFLKNENCSNYGREPNILQPKMK